MNGFGIDNPTSFDPFGAAYSKMMQAVPRRPVPPTPMPAYETPRILAQQFMGMPNIRAEAMMNPAAGMMRRMGVPSNVVPFSPIQPPAPAPQEGTLSPADITSIIRKAESSGNYTALNREAAGNTASGAYQYTDSTWNNYGGYRKAMLAPPEVQDRRFQEDLAKRFQQHNGDPFRIIAHHYLPAYADNPETWTQSVQVGRKKVRPVATYIRHVIRGTPLEAQFDAYLRNNQNR